MVTISFYSLFRKQPINIKYNIYSHRFYGEYKLAKPKELKGIKQILSIDYIPKKCRCQVFILDSDIWVKHGDYFSEVIPPEPHELGMPLNYFAEKYLGKSRPKKFVYGDAWGSVVAKNEAWIKIDSLVSEINSGKFVLDIINEITRQQEIHHDFEEYELSCSYMERFWENVVKELKDMKIE